MVPTKLCLTIIIVIAVNLVCNLILLKKENTDLKSRILNIFVTSCFIIGFILFNVYLDGIDKIFDSKSFSGIIAFILSSCVLEVISELWNKHLKDRNKLRIAATFITDIGFYGIILLILPFFGFATVIK